MDNITATILARGIREATFHCHKASVDAGWYSDPATGERKDRILCEMTALMHNDLSDAMDGERKGLMDDHLPHRKMAEVKLADALIRIFDYAGYCGFDIGGAVVEKMAYNARRADHKPEARAAAGGKKW